MWLRALIALLPAAAGTLAMADPSAPPAQAPASGRAVAGAEGGRARARELGVAPGIFAPGPKNAITDVAGVRVGQVTLDEGDAVRTGVTAILPHGGNLYFERVPAALHVGNGYGKFIGATQLAELGELETPVLLTCTLCVWRAADAMVDWLLAQPGMADVRSINPVVGETNDGRLNDVRARPVTAQAVVRALEEAHGGPVAEGSVGAGRGTVAFGWKGGIGTSSRVLPATLGGYTVGVLVQSNFGGVLQVQGVPVGEALGGYAFEEHVAPSGAAAAPPGAQGSAASPATGASAPAGAGDPAPAPPPPAPRPALTPGGASGGAGQDRGDGSIMMIVATDAPLGDRNLSRLAARAMLGLARTGSAASNGSGDYALAFSTAVQVRRHAGVRHHDAVELANGETSALFQAVVEAVEEAIYNSLFQATTVTGNGTTVEAIPLDAVRELLQRHAPPGGSHPP